MGKTPKAPCKLLVLLESLRGFLSSEERQAQDVEFRIASLIARVSLGGRQRRGRRWTDIHADLLALLHDIFGKNLQLVRSFLPSFSERFLREKLDAMQERALATALVSPVRSRLPASAQPAPVGEFKEVSLRDLKELTVSTPELLASRGRRRTESQSVRPHRSARKYEISALSITDISDFPHSQPHGDGKSFQCPASPLPCFSLARWGAPPSPHVIIERL